MSVQIITGDCRTELGQMPENSVHCCVTSPPYFGLRDYGVDGQIGLEPTLDAYVAEMVAVFQEVRRVLRDGGTFWLNLGDSYNASPGQRKATDAPGAKQASNNGSIGSPSRSIAGLKPKDLMMVPARVALALQADGWWLRSEIIWHKPNPMPESVTDRPTSAHEKVFLLTKSDRYFYDAEAIAEGAIKGASGSTFTNGKTGVTQGDRCSKKDRVEDNRRNARNVWTIATKPFSGAHFATMPPDLVERCIKAGSKPGDTILDPFSGAGTTTLVADRLGRNAVGIELNPEYAAMARNRITDDAGIFGDVA